MRVIPTVRSMRSAVSRWRRSLIPLSQHRFDQARNRRSSTIRIAKGRFVYCKTECLLSFTTGSWALWSRNFCPSILPLTCNSFGHLAWEQYAKAGFLVPHFSFNSNLLCHSVASISFSRLVFFVASPIGAVKFCQTLRSLNASKPPDSDGMPSIVLRTCLRKNVF